MCFRPAAITEKRCGACGAMNELDATACKECGAPLASAGAPAAPGAPGRPGAPAAPGAPKAPGAPAAPGAPKAPGQN